MAKLYFRYGAMNSGKTANALMVKYNYEEVKTICRCGKKATLNARLDENGIIKEGEQVVLGANEKYTSLCRRHWREGNLGE